MELEHSLIPLQALKMHPMAVFWALKVSICVVMEGYDTILIGNFYAYPTFANKCAGRSKRSISSLRGGEIFGGRQKQLNRVSSEVGLVVCYGLIVDESVGSLHSLNLGSNFSVRS